MDMTRSIQVTFGKYGGNHCLYQGLEIIPPKLLLQPSFALNHYAGVQGIRKEQASCDILFQILWSVKVVDTALSKAPFK